MAIFKIRAADFDFSGRSEKVSLVALGRQNCSSSGELLLERSQDQVSAFTISVTRLNFQHE